MAEKVLVYQMWPLSWGTIKAMTLFLSKVKALGADYVWLSPIYTSPWKNSGYDVSDHFSIDTRFGTMADFDEFVKTAHRLGLKVIMDLVIDSTSTEHLWFQTNKKAYYIWTKNKSADWQRLFTKECAWAYDEHTREYYLAIRHPAQADLEWFPGGIMNRVLAEYYKSVMSFWMHSHGVDGFRVGSSQLLNKGVYQKEMHLHDLLIGRKAATAINEISNIYGGKTPVFMLEAFDRDGTAVEYYSEETDVEFITNTVLKSTVTRSSESLNGLRSRIEKHSRNHKFMLNLESHDSVRFTSKTGLDGKEALDLMFSFENVNAICLYQGQELGLKNLPEKDLPLEKIIELDPGAVWKLRNNASPVSILAHSPANNRLPLPLEEYARQEQEKTSVLNHAKTVIQKWKAI